MTNFQKVICILMSDDCGAYIFEDLSTANVILVVVTVEEILDRLRGDVPDSFKHLFGVFSSYGLNDYDSIPCHNEHGEVGPIRCKAVDPISYLKCWYEKEGRI